MRVSGGAIDELQLHLVPLLLGGGERSFDGLAPTALSLEVVRVVDSPRVTHLRYAVRRGPAR